MTRKQVRMELISHAPTRLATFKKRKASILKKASELSILCAVPVCVVVSDGSSTSSPEIWPESDKAGEIISRFNSLSETEQTKKMVDKNGFVTQQIVKKMQQLERINRENQELEARVLLRNLLDGNFSVTDLQDRELVMRLKMLVERQIGEIQKRKEELLHVSQPVPVQTVLQSEVACGTSSMQAIVPVQTGPESDVACCNGSLSDIVPVQTPPQSDTACHTGSMSDIVPVQTVPESEKNFSPLVDGFGEKEEIFDLSSVPLWWFEGEKEMPLLAQKPNGVFGGFSEKKDWVSESSSDVFALPDWSESDQEIMKLFDDFGDYKEMADIVSYF